MAENSTSTTNIWFFIMVLFFSCDAFIHVDAFYTLLSKLFISTPRQCYFNVSFQAFPGLTPTDNTWQKSFGSR